MDFLGDNLIVAYAIGLIMLFFLIRMFYTPLKIALKLVGNALAGGIFLLFINVVGGIVNIQIGINLFTALVVGILGVPGAALMLILQVVLSA
ncbi:MAG: pro-sigmaK processing inhibitor BofA family protein [Clostridia bacterium]|nr:pro-sigmaK processing inhibitor BofA family protein [Clostridia bacterium]